MQFGNDKLLKVIEGIIEKGTDRIKPYRDYYDASVGCWLRIAENDPYTQIISNE